VLAVRPEAREDVAPVPLLASIADAGAPDAEAPAEEAVAAPAADPMRVVELPNAVVVRVRRDLGATSIAITTRVASADPARERAGEARNTLMVRPRDLVAGLELASARVRAALAEGGGLDVFELRRRAGATRRKQLEQAPFGRSWITLGEALFPLSPKLHPLAGTVLGATADPAALRDTLLADLVQGERGRARASITLVGELDEGYALRLAETIAGAIPAPPPLDTSLPRPERLLLNAPVNEARGLYGWVARAESEDDEAALRVALELLEGGRLERALVGDAGLAADAHAGAELLGSRTWVITLEASIAPGHTINELEKALDAELGRLAVGPDAAEVRAAVDRARERAIADLTAADAVTGPAGGPSAALAASLRRACDGPRAAEVARKIGAVGEAAVGAAIRRFLPPDRRVVVISTPRGHGAAQRVASR
jgi:predicted Zn-dependent peptidase